MYQVQAISESPYRRMSFGSFPDKESAKEFAIELVGTIEVVDERLGRLVGTSVESEWTECTGVERRPIL